MQNLKYRVLKWEHLFIKTLKNTTLLLITELTTCFPGNRYCRLQRNQLSHGTLINIPTPLSIVNKDFKQ